MQWIRGDLQRPIFVLYSVEPLLCNDREVGGYNRNVSGQRLGKHVPIAGQEIFNNATAGLQQWKSCVFYVLRAAEVISETRFVT
jgi:hypothetical protein